MERLRFVLILLIAVVLVGAGCDSGSEKKSLLNPYTSTYSGETTRDCSDLYPSNPYNDGSGHYAGFEWAEDRGVSSCGGNSNSFIEGCEEYLQQEESYQECVNQ